MSALRGWLLVLALGAGAAPARDLGRLFFTPEERAQLDAARRAPPVAAADEATEPAAPPELAPDAPRAAASPPLTVNGLVRRAHGPSTAWINGAPGTPGELVQDDGRRLRIGQDAVELGAAAGRARVKPGQTYDPAAGRVVESFERAPADAAAAP
ncbi:MAG TPA: hypothetical protein PJ986_01195 [Gammaproteobacteria bacterium]|nr:hypothetical protein [Gammaproteobacteria bacterium]